MIYWLIRLKLSAQYLNRRLAAPRFLRSDKVILAWIRLSLTQVALSQLSWCFSCYTWKYAMSSMKGTYTHVFLLNEYLVELATSPFTLIYNMLVYIWWPKRKPDQMRPWFDVKDSKEATIEDFKQVIVFINLFKIFNVRFVHLSMI